MGNYWKVAVNSITKRRGKDMSKKIITIEEYNDEGKLIKKTTTETEEESVYPIVYPYYPSYPIYPNNPWVTVTY
jgi:hypothetical protein